MDERPVVFSLYGIRTRGAWQKAALNLVLTEGGFTHIPLDYGHFALWRFLLPSARQKKIEEFLQEYTTYTEQTISTHPGGRRTSVITHSFGTYIVAAALLRYPEIRFDNIIFCGSIVRSDFPWSKVIAEEKQVKRVLNEQAKQDVWVRVVQWVVRDAGPSGVEGFQDTAGGMVIERHHPA